MQKAETYLWRDFDFGTPPLQPEAVKAKTALFPRP
jgi:hypothetical protein